MNLLAAYDEYSKEDPDLHVHEFDSVDVRMRVTEVQENSDKIHGEDCGLDVEVHLIAPEWEIVEEFALLEEKDVHEWAEHEVEKNVVEEELRQHA